MTKKISEAASKKELLEKLHAELEELADQKELPLATKSDDIVPGEGNPDAEIMFIGEAPGYHESIQRRPFVGRSGKFLRQTIQEVGHSQDQVYISNIVKIRPPENRDPLPKEISAFRPFLNREIEIIDPTLMVTLGRFSMAKFLPDVKISQVHGRLHKVIWNENNLFVLPMYHPAAGLRSGKVRESFVSDFKKISKILHWVKQQSKNIQFEEEVREALL